MENITIFLINDFGGGFSANKTIPAGTTVKQLFASVNPGQDPRNFFIRVAREAAPESYVLQDGERVSITPIKVTGMIPAQPGMFRRVLRKLGLVA